MTERALLAIIEQEARSAIGADDTSRSDREKMLSAYMGEAKGDLAPPDIEGRSRVVSKDLMDTVEWTMPSLMRMFTGSDDVIRFAPEDEEDEQAVDDATEYCGYLFFRKNAGFTVLHDAIKNSLIQRQAAVKVWCEVSTEQASERYEGVSMMDVQALSEDLDVEITELAEAGEAMGEQGPEPAFNVVARRKSEKKHHKVVGVPPEELRFNKDARQIEDARFVQHRTKRTVSDLLAMGYERRKVLTVPANSDDERDEQREHDDGLSTEDSQRMDEALREIELCETYIKADFDNDGIAEMRKVVHAGLVVFENEETDDHPFALFCPVLMPYKAIGLGMWDLVEDLQRIRTFLTRQLLDNAALANNPQRAVVDGQVNLDDLLNPRVGGLIRMKSLDAMRTDMTPFVGNQVMALLDHFGNVRDKRTGVTEFNQGLGADALSKTEIGSEGAQSMMDAAMQRVELIARVLAETGMARVWKLLLKGAVQYADRAEQVKVNGRWLRVNPREWKTGYDTEVTIGIGHNSQQQKVRNLALIGQAQEKLMQIGVVTPENAYNTAVELAQAVGYRNTDRFFTNPKDAPPQQDGPPIEIQLEQMKQQGAQALAQAKMQADAQLAQMKGQSDAQLAQVKAQADIEVSRMEQEFQAQQDTMSKQIESERDAQKLQAQMALEQFKVEKQMEIEAYKAELAHNTAIQTAQIGAQTAARVA